MTKDLAIAGLNEGGPEAHIHRVPGVSNSLRLRESCIGRRGPLRCVDDQRDCPIKEPNEAHEENHL